MDAQDAVTLYHYFSVLAIANAPAEPSLISRCSWDVRLPDCRPTSLFIKYLGVPRIGPSQKSLVIKLRLAEVRRSALAMNMRGCTRSYFKGLPLVC